MKKTLRRAVVLGLLAFAAPFAALPLAKPAAAMPEASAPVLPDAVEAEYEQNLQNARADARRAREPQL